VTDLARPPAVRLLEERLAALPALSPGDVVELFAGAARLSPLEVEVEESGPAMRVVLYLPRGIDALGDDEVEATASVALEIERRRPGLDVDVVLARRSPPARSRLVLGARRAS
jgi:hypothetical protein